MSDKTPKKEAFELKQFLPYRLAVLADSVSQSIAQLYTHQFSLTRSEWRIIAALADTPEMTGKQLTQYTTLDKMQVSRAVTRLESQGYLARKEDPNDRRNKSLCLTPNGQKLLGQIIPLVQEREAFLLGSLSKDEQRQYAELSDKIHDQAQKILTSCNDEESPPTD